MVHASSIPKYLLVGSLLCGMTLLPERAQACSRALHVIESAYPERGAVEVPTNVVLFVYGPDLDSADDVELRNANGDVVPVDARPAEPSGFDLFPLAELEPNQNYELRAPAESELTSPWFTTGSGPAEIPQQLGAPALDVRMLNHALGSCGDVTRICLHASPQPSTTFEVRVGEEVLSGRSAHPSIPYEEYGQGLAHGECLEVRTRDARGNRSEPSIACGDALQHVWLSLNVPDSGYTCENYAGFIESAQPDPPPTESASCSVSHPGVARRNVAWAAWGVAALLLVRGRRRTR